MHRGHQQDEAEQQPVAAADRVGISSPEKEKEQRSGTGSSSLGQLERSGECVQNPEGAVVESPATAVVEPGLQHPGIVIEGVASADNSGDQRNVPARPAP